MERNQAVLPHRPFFPDAPSSLMTDDVDDSKAVHCPLSAGGAMRALTVELVKKTVAQKVRAYVLMNNRSEGNAPLTIQALV